MRKILTILWFFLSVLWVTNAKILTVVEMANNENLNLIMYFMIFLIVITLLTLIYYLFQVIISLIKRRKMGLSYVFDILAIILSAVLLSTFASFAMTTVNFASSDSITVMTGLAFLSQVPKVLSGVSNLLLALPVVVIGGTAYYIYHQTHLKTGENFTQQLKPSKKK